MDHLSITVVVLGTTIGSIAMGVSILLWPRPTLDFAFRHRGSYAEASQFELIVSKIIAVLSLGTGIQLCFVSLIVLRGWF